VEPPIADYALLDAGDGRRLERFGDVVLDRPAPGTTGLARRDPAAWERATARFEREEGAASGAWLPPGAVPDRWTIGVDGVTLELRPAPAGQVGVFPEHVAVARWAAGRARAVAGAREGMTPAGQPARVPTASASEPAASIAGGRPADVLSLFAYTGLATLVLARAGASVAHVDASRPAVAWARRNAGLSGLADRPIRWLVEDAARFVAREARRGRRYDGVLLDPPTYGHGPGGSAWRLEDDLGGLLTAVRSVLVDGPWFVACTAHAAGLPGSDLEAVVRSGLGIGVASTELRELSLSAESGARLHAGWAVLAADGPGAGT
jgi:23S rRNA (cytosine1962-C5)-methyltransferase